MLAELASKALVATCSLQNIRSGFMKTSIVPFNLHALDLDFGPSLMFEDGDKPDLGGGNPGLNEGDSDLGEGLGEGDLLEVDRDQANDAKVEEEQLSQ